MSAFGYGSSYNPSWRGNLQAQNNQQSNPVFGISPEMPQPNFRPVGTTPWEDPTVRTVGSWSSNGGGYDLGNLAHGGRSEGNQGNFVAQDAWKNPLDRIYGSGPTGQGAPDVLGMPTNLQPVYGFPTWSGGGANSADAAMRGLGPMQIGQRAQSQNPVDAKELYNSIGGLTVQQLQRLGGGHGLVRDKFSAAAQDYANAYMNPNYGKHMAYQQGSDYGQNSMSQGENMDWLQKAYNKSLTRLNNNYLL